MNKAQELFNTLMTANMTAQDAIDLINAVKTLQRLGIQAGFLEVSEHAKAAHGALVVGGAETAPTAEELERFKLANPAATSRDSWENKIRLIKALREKFPMSLYNAKICVELLYDEQNMAHRKQLR